MKTIDLKGNPFYLNDDEVRWVEETQQAMTIEEKIGQLFFLMGFTTNEAELKAVVKTIRPGGMMYRPSGHKKVAAAHRVLQANSKIPMLLAANLETGGVGLISDGTDFGHEMLIGATDDDRYAYKLGFISGTEAASVGGNMAFAPIIDINYNFRNPIVNIRTFGDRPELVARMGAAYVKGARDAGLSVTIKHFPGDGTDGRDQHLVTTHNHLSVEDWRKTFGLAYKTSINDGALGLMVGHIGLPAYFEADDSLKYMPATLNPVLLNKLLREELGYNGLTMTDASLMTGFGEKGRREDLVPRCIAAGCDMFLFTRNPVDDYNHMMNGYKSGVISDERLEEALTRILAIKASLKLNGKSPQELVPDSFDRIDLFKHQLWAEDLADAGVTLVKDEAGLLPLTPARFRRIGIFYNGNESMMKTIFQNMPGFKGLMIRLMMRLTQKKEREPYAKLIDELNIHGFAAFHYDFGDFLTIMNDMNTKTLAEWKSQFDLIIFLAKWETASNQTSLQLQYKAMGFDAPWFVEEVPTILVSVGNPYHGYDLPMIKTVINGYSPTDAVYKAIAAKLAGKSEFKGKSPVRLDFKEFTGELD